MNARQTSGQNAAIAVLLLAVGGAVTVAAANHAEADGPLPASVWRVVQVHCANGRIQHGVDTGRPDGLLLAHDTGMAC